MSVAIAELPAARLATTERHDLVTLARQQLERHPHFRGRTSGVQIELCGRTLILSGSLPTFYLKQLLQEAIRRLPGGYQVRNEIDVVSPYGISSVRE